MAVPFSRTQRALADDHFYITLALTPLVTLCILGAMYWGCSAPIAIYQRSESATMRTPQIVTAYFSVALLDSMRPDQPALLYLRGFPADEYEPIVVQIVHINNALQDGQLEVRLQVTDASASLPLRPGLEGVVEIQTQHKTPLQLLVQTLNRRFAGNQL